MELSIGEMLVVALVIVVLFGPDKIPSIARELGQGIRKMKGAMEDIKTEIMKEADNPLSDIKKEIDKVKQSVADINPMNDVQKQIEDMKSAINPMDQHVADNSSVPAHTDTPAPVSEPAASAEAEKKIDPLSDEYSGSVSR